jgi:hypothetical protein
MSSRPNLNGEALRIEFDASLLEPTCPGLPVPANVAAQSQSQQSAGANVMFNQAGQNMATGIGNAIGEAFGSGAGNSVSGNIDDGTGSGSAYVSLRGMRSASQDRLKRRIAIANGTYVAPRAGSGAGLDSEGQQAIAAAFPDAAPAVSYGTAHGSTDGQVDDGLFSYDTLVDPLLKAETSRWNVWVRGTVTHFDGDAFSGDTWNGIAGADYRYNPDIIVGGLVGYEVGDFNFDTTNGAFEGTGFTTGAYVGVKLSDGLVLDAFLTHSWLGYDNRAGTATGDTDATRLMVSLNITGRHQLTENLVIEPNARVFYAHESQDAYRLSDGSVVGANSIDSGRLSIGPTFRYFIPDTSKGVWSVKASAHAEFDLSSEKQTSSALPDFNGLVSARLGAGVDGTLVNGWMVSLAGDVGGLGSGSFVSYTGTGKVRVPLN